MTFAGARALVNRLMSGMWSTMEIIRESSGINWIWLRTLFKGTPFSPLDIIGHHSEGGGGRGGWIVGASGPSCLSTEFKKAGEMSKITLTNTHMTCIKHHCTLLSYVLNAIVLKCITSIKWGNVIMIFHVHSSCTKSL